MKPLDASPSLGLQSNGLALLQLKWKSCPRRTALKAAVAGAGMIAVGA